MASLSARVAAIIPCYNHGRYVTTAIDSVLEQTFTDVVVVVVDDGSTEPATVECLRAIDRPRTTVLHKENGHLSSARNHGIANSSSEYVLTLDADDYFEPSFLEQAVSVLDSDPTVGVVTCNARAFGAESGTRQRQGGRLQDFLLCNNCCASALFRRECWDVVGGYNESMKQGYEDWDFWLGIAAKGWSFHRLDELLLNYRVVPGSMVSHSDRIRPELMRQLVDNHLGAYREHVAWVVFEEERRIQDLQQRVDVIRGSAAYRLGRCLTDPFGVLRGIVRKIRRCSTE